MTDATFKGRFRRVLRLSLFVAACVTWGFPARVLAEGPSAAADADAATDGTTAAKTVTKEKVKPEVDKPKAAESAAGHAQPPAKSKTTKAVKVRLAQFVLENELPETTGQMGLFGETETNLRELVSRIDKAASDDSIAGAVLDIRQPEVGRAKVEELRGAIARFRASGKKAYAHMDMATPSDYLIACACDEIVMPETGMVFLPGIRAQGMFFKGLLGKLGIEGDFIHMGPYKGAAEPLMRKSFSQPVRENMTALVDGLYDQLVTTIVKDRPISVAQAKEIIDTGLVTATDAKKLGLIDKIAYPDTVRSELTKVYNAKPLVYVENYGKKKVDTDFSGPTGFFKLMQTLLGETKEEEAKGRKIAIVYAVGPIITGKADDSLFADQVVASDTLVEALRDAASDTEVAAVVLRVDSPGGSALASDLIWHQTQEMGKPLVASMGDVAGSGGYYISMGADKIIAAPGTITGSIGVVGGKISLKGLYSKVGITTDTIQRGANSGLFSLDDKFTDSEREVLKKLMEDMYGQFTAKAAQGRHMPLEKVKELAGGRIYTGRQARDNGLVDELGTLHDALVEAKKLAGMEPDAEVRIEVLPKPTNIFEALFGEGQTEKEVRVQRYLDQFAPGLGRATRQAYWLRTIFAQPTAAVIMPFELTIR